MAHSSQRKEDRFPPILLRLLAVRYPQGRRGMPIILTDDELLKRGTLSLADFKWLSYSLSWDEIPGAKKRAWKKMCGTNFDNWRSYSRLVRLASRGAFRHLKSSPLWETQFCEMLNLYNARPRTASPAS